MRVFVGGGVGGGQGRTLRSLCTLTRSDFSNLHCVPVLQLAAFGDTSGQDLPPLELPDQDRDRGPIMPVPKGIRPVLSKHRIEVLVAADRCLLRTNGCYGQVQYSLSPRASDRCSASTGERCWSLRTGACYGQVVVIDRSSIPCPKGVRPVLSDHRIETLFDCYSHVEKCCEMSE